MTKGNSSEGKTDFEKAELDLLSTKFKKQVQGAIQARSERNTVRVTVQTCKIVHKHSS